MSRNFHRLEWLDNTFECDLPDVIASKVGCDKKTASSIAYQQKAAWNNRDQSAKLRFDPTTQLWRGRSVNVKRESLGLPRKNGRPDTLRLTLRRIMGGQHYTTPALNKLLSEQYGEKADSKARQARSRGYIKYDRETQTWRFHLINPPDPADFVAGADDNEYEELVFRYGSMPRCRHKVGDDKFDPATSEVLRYIAQRSETDDLHWCEKEFRRFYRSGAKNRTKQLFVYDRNTHETMGILTHLAEVEDADSKAAKKHEAAAKKHEADEIERKEAEKQRIAAEHERAKQQKQELWRKEVGEELTSIWIKLVDEIRRRRPLILSWIDKATPLDQIGVEVLIGFPPDDKVAMESLLRPSNHKFIEELLTEIAGAPRTLRTELRG